MKRQIRIDIEVGGRMLSLESGTLAKQADGSVVARYGDSMVLCTAVQAKKPKENVDFLPLTCDYREGMYAQGRFPGGFFKREGRPTDKETLTSRLIDRPIRPMFPENYHYETQLIATVISNDVVNDPDVVALCGVGAALYWSPIPFMQPIAGVRIGRVDGRLIVNPTREEVETGTLALVVAGTEDALLMVESGAKEVDEETMLDALQLAHAEIRKICAAVRAAVPASELAKRAVPAPVEDEALRAHINANFTAPLLEAMQVRGKLEMYAAMDAVKDSLIKSLGETVEDARKSLAKRYYEELTIRLFRSFLLERRQRLDGRAMDTIRPISIQVGLLPRVHGSSVFTRGETQALGMVTLGTSNDQQLIDWYAPDAKKRFMLNYNFPPYSVNEVKFLRSPGRREIGHGALAERALLPLLPPVTEFPYTIRVVSEILESNGSSSQATVCVASLSMMDAGVPLKAACAGVAMGLIKEGDKYAVLSDIAGLEDHYGDMDFKVAGTRQGITALQMDIKVDGLSMEILREALAQARTGRMHILDLMEQTIPSARKEMNPFAPRILTIPVPNDKIGMIIGPGGKMIRSIEEKTGATVEIDDATSTVQVASSNLAAAEAALEIIKGIIAEAEVGKTYMGKVMRVENYGAFIEILPGKEGLLHVSEMSAERVERVEDVVKLGDEILVKVVPSDMPGKIRLSRKAIFGGEGGDDKPRGGGGRGRDDRGPRRDDRPRREDRFGGRDDRPARDARPMRDERPPVRDERPARDDDRYPAREERGHREDRPSFRDDRPARDDRGPRDDRPAFRDDRPSFRDDRPARDDRGPREERGGRETWRDRDEPAPRGGDREEYRPSSDRGPRDGRRRF